MFIKHIFKKSKKYKTHDYSVTINSIKNIFNEVFWYVVTSIVSVMYDTKGSINERMVNWWNQLRYA